VVTGSLEERRSPIGSSSENMPESRPRDLTPAELAAIDAVTQALAPKPVLTPPPTASIATGLTSLENQSRPSETMLPAAEASSEQVVSRSKATRARG